MSLFLWRFLSRFKDALRWWESAFRKRAGRATQYSAGLPAVYTAGLASFQVLRVLRREISDAAIRDIVIRLSPSGFKEHSRQDRIERLTPDPVPSMIDEYNRRIQERIAALDTRARDRQSLGMDVTYGRDVFDLMRQSRLSIGDSLDQMQARVRELTELAQRTGVPQTVAVQSPAPGTVMLDSVSHRYLTYDGEVWREISTGAVDHGMVIIDPDPTRSYVVGLCTICRQTVPVDREWLRSQDPARLRCPRCSQQAALSPTTPPNQESLIELAELQTQLTDAMLAGYGGMADSIRMRIMDLRQRNRL